VIIAVAAIVLAVELTLVWDQLAKAWKSVYSANWWWVLAGVVAAMSSMHSFAQIQRTLLRSAGVRVTAPSIVAARPGGAGPRARRSAAAAA